MLFTSFPTDCSLGCHFADFTSTTLSLYFGSHHITRILTLNINLHSLSCSQAHVQVTNSLSSLKILDFFLQSFSSPLSCPLLPVFPLQFSQTLKLPPDLLSLNKLQIIQLPARVRWGSSEPLTTELGTKKRQPETLITPTCILQPQQGLLSRAHHQARWCHRVLEVPPEIK